MSTRRKRSSNTPGFSLIELLVSMVIALVVTLAISSVLLRSEGNKRSTTSVNDLNQTSSYLAYVLDRTIRSAGSGFAQNWLSTFGCAINASKNGTAILPLPSAASAPFNNVPLRVRLAPVVIGKGLADSGGQVRGDVLTVMGSTSGAGDLPQSVLPGSVSATSLRITNTLGYSNNDMVLLATNVAGADCLAQQVAPAAGVAADQLNFLGASYSKNIPLPSPYSGTGIAIQMGSAPANPPQMLLYGVGDNNTLFNYDLLRVVSGDVTPIADGVIEMRALYGVDNKAVLDGILTNWVDPIAGSGYSMAELTNGSAAAQINLRRIIAVRVGLILRTSLQERIGDRYYGQYANTVDPATLPTTTLTLFGDLPAAQRQSRAIVGADNLYRYRTIEFTVPLRNTQFAPTSFTP